MNPQGPFNEEQGNEEELRRFFMQAGLPAPDKSLHLDRSKLKGPPSISTRRLGMHVEWLWVTLSVAIFLILFLIIPPVAHILPQSATSGTMGAATHSTTKQPPISPQQQQAVNVVRQYLKTHHENPGPILAVRKIPATTANQILGRTFAASTPIWRITVSGPLSDNQRIVFPALTFYVNQSDHRVEFSGYGPINRQEARTIATQWANLHRLPTAPVHPVVMSVIQVTKTALIHKAGWQPGIPAWVWQVTFRENLRNPSRQVIYINPATGSVMIWKF
ncbi:MAG: hypothetical protein M1493_14235 [Firmicutes bacterium]|nr:hypothetical protein [Bacillota bacterium]